MGNPVLGQRLGMQERIEALGGDFQVDSAPGEGTTITVTLPAPTQGSTADDAGVAGGFDDE